MSNKETEKWRKAVGLMNRMDEAEGKHLNFVEHGNNRLPLVPLNESDIAKYLDRHNDMGYIIISACRGEQDFPEIQSMENPMQKENELNRINNERSKELENLIRQSGFTYKPVFGGFKEESSDDFSYEKSYLVLPCGKGNEMHTFEELDAFGLEMCNKFNQDCYLRVSPNGKTEYIAKDGSVDFDGFNGKTFNDFTQQYFTDLHKNSDKYKDSTNPNDPVRPTRFTLKEVYVNPRPISYQEGHMRWHNGELADWSAK